MSHFPERPFANLNTQTLEDTRKQELAKALVCASLATFTLERGALVGRIVIETNLPPMETALILLIPALIIGAGSIVAKSALESFRNFSNARNETRIRYLITTGQLSEPAPKTPGQGSTRPQILKL